MEYENCIPKIIHYCWFGKEEKPPIVLNCIEGWNKVLKGYEIKEWNENNFDINSNKFVKQAYEAKKYAFVSDYVRVYALYNYGGIYLDTDVEVLKSFDNYLYNESFWGFEAGNFIATSTIGAKKHNQIIKKFLEQYKNKVFITDNGGYNTETNVKTVSQIMKDLGVELNGRAQKIDNLATIYPMEVFSPYDYRTFKDFRNKYTVAIHHYYKSWIPKKMLFKQKIKKIVIRIVGINKYKRIIGIE